MRRLALTAAAAVLIPTVPAWAQQTDVIGGDYGQNDGSASFKLSVYEVQEAVLLDEFEAWIEPVGNGVEVWFMVYQRGNQGRWDLVWDSGNAQAISGGLDFKSSGNIGLVLDPGEDYALGIFMEGGNDVSYYWGDVGGQDLGWAFVGEAVFASNGTVGGSSPPDPLFGNGSDSPYRQRVTVSFGEDVDGDGAGSFVDCDDTDPTVFPGADEACDGVDNNCNGEVDENVLYRDVYPDADGDGFGDPDGTPVNLCEPETPDGYAENFRDCDDTNAAVNPDAPEICDGFDNDCDGELLPDEDIDADGDGVPVCEDCNDDDPLIYPGRPDDPCNGKDNDCDGNIPESKEECDPLEAGEGISIGSACGACTTGGAPGAMWAFPLLFAVIRRRD